MSAAVAEVLRKARALIADENAWIRNNLAVNHEGAVVLSADSDACKWCALGAIDKVANFLHSPGFEARDAMIRAAGVDPEDDGLGDWNDAPERTHAEVLAAFDRAIEAEEATP